MMITFSKQDFIVELSEEWVCELIIENQREFSDIIKTLLSQKECDNEEIILSHNYEIQKFNNNVEIITSFIPFEINKKELLTKLYNQLKKISVNEEWYEKTIGIISEVENFIYDITDDYDEGISVTSPSDISGFLKLFDVKFDLNTDSIAETLFEYAGIVRKFLDKKVFVSVNLRSFVSDDECEMFYKTLTDHKIIWICIESSERTKLAYSKRTILDKDLCLI
ncbi:MAG: type II-A CRISPR-associated protein Csn2 [Oscillospiraceae bacterium]|nr:type II-A CRISPR-associated protein Csn2 [Oscillospiraceae bacterium]MBQ8379145.1 type II-A CRISPR-associated protein Csn2 [Oscillospiraceae bacterium]